MTKKTKTKAQKKAEEDANLDEALAETFPASDPPSMTQPRTGAGAPQRRPRRHPKGEMPPRKITNHQLRGCPVRTHTSLMKFASQCAIELRTATAEFRSFRSGVHSFLITVLSK
jgi:hypothetical protein